MLIGGTGLVSKFGLKNPFRGSGARQQQAAEAGMGRLTAPQGTTTTGTAARELEAIQQEESSRGGALLQK